ncbi:Lysophospholipid acyltransferase [uncultured Candidatus Thioglobus sp.]|nr:Lysophospholipid acyltransferase [uncultured Candidatus Thioglobus sp.]
MYLICWLALNISRSFARFWLYPITAYFFLTSSKVRRASKNYLRRTKLSKHGLFQTLKHIYYFSAVILDRVYFITDRTEKFDIKVVNEALVSKLSQDNSGFILFGSHLGGFDILQSLKSKYGQASVVMDITHNSMITDILYNLNPVMFDAIIDANSDNALLEIKENLDNAQFVAILADRKIDQQKTIKCSLLGDDIQIPKSPFALPYILKKPAIVFFGIYVGKNKYEIHFKELKINHQDARTNREQNIAKDAQTYTSYMQEMIEKYPFNWFNFYDYWGDE